MQITVRVHGTDCLDLHVSSHDGVMIGRSGTHLRVRDEYCSNQHAFLYVSRNGDLMLRDMGSRNGTYLNGQRIRTAKIGAGDTIKVGRTNIEILEIESEGPITKSETNSSRILSEPRIELVPIVSDSSPESVVWRPDYVK